MMDTLRLRTTTVALCIALVLLLVLSALDGPKDKRFGDAARDDQRLTVETTTTTGIERHDNEGDTTNAPRRPEQDDGSRATTATTTAAPPADTTVKRRPPISRDASDDAAAEEDDPTYSPTAPAATKARKTAGAAAAAAARPTSGNAASSSSAAGAEEPDSPQQPARRNEKAQPVALAKKQDEAPPRDFSGGTATGEDPCTTVYALRDSLENLQNGNWRNADLGPLTRIHKALEEQVPAAAASASSHLGELDAGRKVLLRLTENRRVKTICEVGFGAGFGAALWLHANPTAQVHVFDDLDGGGISTPSRLAKDAKKALLTMPDLKSVDKRLNFFTDERYTTKQVFALAAEDPSLKCNVLFINAATIAAASSSTSSKEENSKQKEPSSSSSTPDGEHALMLNLRDLRTLADPDYHVLAVHGIGQPSVDRWVARHQQLGTLVPVLETHEEVTREMSGGDEATTTTMAVAGGVGVYQYHIETPTCPETRKQALAGARAFRSVLNGDWKRESLQRANEAMEAAARWVHGPNATSTSGIPGGGGGGGGDADGMAAEAGANSDQHYLRDLKAQRRIYATLARMEHVSTICEVASNGGSSAALWLKMKPAAKVILFDPREESAAAAEKLKTMASVFGAGVDKRFIIVKGSPLVSTIAAFALNNPGVKCDLLHYIGTIPSAKETPLAILQRLRSLANPRFHVGTIDNTNCEVDGDVCDNESELVSALNHKLLQTQIHLSEKKGRRGVTVFRFNLGGGGGASTLCRTPFTPEIATEAHKELHEIVANGSWKRVPLDEYNAVLTVLERALSNNVLGQRGAPNAGGGGGGGDSRRVRTSSSDVEGHSGQLTIERQVYISLAQMSNVKTICEIGFNGGHSAALWLQANPNANVIMFDLWHRRASKAGEAFLLGEQAEDAGLKKVNHRLKIIKGDSRVTVPKFFAENPATKCDVISVDGAHSIGMAINDLKFMKNFANPDFHVGVIDDTNCDSNWCVDAAVTEMQKRGQLRTILHLSEQAFERGVTVFQYKLDTQASCDVDDDPPTTSTRETARDELASIVRDGSWSRVNLRPYDKLADDIDAHCGDGCDGEGGSIDLVHERQIYVKLARMKNVKRICEIGFNKGHTAGLWLKANPKAEVIMFDLWKWRAAIKGDQFLRLTERQNGIKNAPGTRLTVVKGFSTLTVRKFAADNPDVKCDLLIVDGGHEFKVAEKDINNMKMLANPDFHVVAIDDTNCWQAGVCVDGAVQEQQERLQIKAFYALGEVRHSKDKREMDRGVSLFHYDLRLPMP